jgi:hypothetical protein
VPHKYILGTISNCLSLSVYFFVKFIKNHKNFYSNKILSDHIKIKNFLKKYKNGPMVFPSKINKKKALKNALGEFFSILGIFFLFLEIFL